MLKLIYHKIFCTTNRLAVTNFYPLILPNVEIVANPEHKTDTWLYKFNIFTKFLQFGWNLAQR